MTRQAFVVELNAEKDFQRLLPGQPDTCGMKAGRVYLEPGKDCGQHSTGEREEMLIFLSGSGRALIEPGQEFEVGVGKVAYIPPATLHNIENTGTVPLIYIYCVAPTA